MAIFSGDELNPSEINSPITGDTDLMVGSDRGGDDFFYGDSDSIGYVAFGDAFEMQGKSVGGNDLFYAGDYVGNPVILPLVPESITSQADPFFGDAAVFGGDADIMGGSSRGGNDTMSGGYQSSNVFMGDALTEMDGGARGGADSLTGGNAGDGYSTNALIGDAFWMGGGSTGGADELYGGSAGFQVVPAGASAQVVPPGGDGYALNVMSGDAMMLMDRAHAGDDLLVGGSSIGGVSEVSTSVVESFGSVSFNFMAGDSFGTEGRVGLGDDDMTGGSGSSVDGYAVNLMFGDVGDPEVLFNEFPFEPIVNGLDAPQAFASPGKPAALNYGDDVMTGGDGFALNMLVGDAYELSSRGRAGDDVLIAGNGESMNTLVGDAIIMDGKARGGNDILISGDGPDVMWGDSQNLGGRGGKDTFVFEPGNGQDMIKDFDVRERDKIDLSAFDGSEFRSFRDLLASGRLQVSGDDVLIDLTVVVERLVSTQVFVEVPPVDSVLLVGVSLADLTAGSFIF